MNQPLPTTTDMVAIPREDYEGIKQAMAELKSQNEQLRTELDKLRRELYSASSERFIATLSDPAQIHLELQGVENPPPPAQLSTITYTRRKGNESKKGHSRLEFPDSLPRETIVIEPKQDVTGWKLIGEEVSQYLAVHPPKFFVKRIIRKKYAAPDGEVVVIGPLPLMPIHKSNVDASIIAMIISNKYVLHLPWYRQSQMFQREGIILPESTMIGQVKAVCQLLEPLFELQKQRVFQSHYLQADETPLPVLTRDHPGAAHKGYLWFYFDPITGNVYIEYQKGRGRDGPVKLLDGFTGALQTDGYSVYDIFDRKPGITLLGCLAHARRKFTEAAYTNKSLAEEMLKLIQKLYAIERNIQGQAPEIIHETRQQQAIPILHEIEQWLKTHVQDTLPKSAIGKAIGYMLGLWLRLIRYTEDGRYRIDNNLVENAIRGVALGRKNFLFAGSHDAASRTAMLYSFVGTCKQLHIDAQTWMEDILNRLPYFKRGSDLSVLLPCNWKPERQSDENPEVA